MFRISLLAVCLLATIATAQPRRTAMQTGSDRFKTATEPFDLTYLPRPPADVQMMLAVRPAAILARPAARTSIPELNALFLQMAGMVGIAGGGPGIENLETAILCGHITVTENPQPATKTEKPAFLMLGASGCLLRTVKPFDWSAAIRSWFPAATVRRHRGETYFSVPIPEQFIPLAFTNGKTSNVSFFVPDDRTLVIDDSDTLCGLIDRLKDHVPQDAPAGWERISRDTIAMAIDNRDKRWVACLPRHPGPEGPDLASVTFKSADHLAVGLDLGARTKLTIVSFSPTQFLGTAARNGRREMCKRFADHLSHDPAKPTPESKRLTDVLDRLLLDGRTTPTPLGFVYRSELNEDLIRRILDAAAGESTAPAPMVVKPRAGGY